MLKMGFLSYGLLVLKRRTDGSRGGSDIAPTPMRRGLYLSFKFIGVVYRL